MKQISNDDSSQIVYNYYYYYLHVSRRNSQIWESNGKIEKSILQKF